MKRFFALMLAAALCLSLAACGGGGGTPGGAASAIPLQTGDSIDNEYFSMSFDSMELYDEYSYQTSEYSSTFLYVEEGYKLIVVKGHFDNKSTSVISDNAFVLTAVVNDSFTVDGYDVDLQFVRDKSYEIDPYTDLDYVLSINVPERLAEMLETATFTISFKNDLSVPTTTWYSDGSETTDTDLTYAYTCDFPADGASDSTLSEAPAEENGAASPVQDNVPPAPQSGFEANKDLAVIASFVYDNNTYVVVENVGEQPILNFSVAYLNFDKNGFVTTTDSDGYDSGKYDTANLMPGDKTIAAWFGRTGNYAVAAVRSVDYADGTDWSASASQLHAWADTVRADFSVDGYKAGIAALQETAVQAEHNEYAQLTDFYIEHGNRYSSDLDFHFSVQNTSDQGITMLNVFVLEFDENGFPVSVSPYDTYCINGHRTGGTVNLTAGQSGDYVDDLFLSGSTTQVKVVISNIEFQDGSAWQNPYIYEWILANNSSY